VADSKITGLSAQTTVADTDSFVLATNANTTKKITGANLKLAIHGTEPATIYKSGVFVTEPFVTGNSAAYLTQDLMVGVPFFIYGSKPVSFASVRVCNVVTAIASSVIRFGVYGVATTGGPGARTYDLGTVDTSATGIKTITSTFILQPGWNYLAFALQVAGNLAMQARGNAPVFVSPLQIFDSTQTRLGSSADCWMPTVASVTGALPDPFGSPTWQAGKYPRFEMVVT
jgi:hypothetical protein